MVTALVQLLLQGFHIGLVANSSPECTHVSERALLPSNRTQANASRSPRRACGKNHGISARKLVSDLKSLYTIIFSVLGVQDSFRLAMYAGRRHRRFDCHEPSALQTTIGYVFLPQH